MSFLLELARDAYPDNALEGFTPGRQFSLDDARAMMWLSQLAYDFCRHDSTGCRKQTGYCQKQHQSRN